MELFDEKIKLRAIKLSDAELLKQLINDPEIEYMVHGWSLPVSLDNQKKWIENLDPNSYRFMIEYDDEVVGTCSISKPDFKNSTAGLNIKLKNDVTYRGKGIGARSIKLLVAYCFDELNLNCLTASILEYNESSLKLFKKYGFVEEGILRSRIYKRGKYRNTIQLSLLKEEYNLERNR